MPGRLNLFQRTMLLWDELHPYNCVHIVRVFAPLDLPRLTEVLNRVLTSLGLSKLTLDSELGTYAFDGGPANYEIKPVPIGADPRAELAAEAARQLNARFAHDQSLQPFRFFVAGEKDAFFLGLVYFHALADGETVTTLLKSVVDAYLGRGEAAGFDFYPRARDGILFRTPGLFVKKLRAIAAGLRTSRHVRRCPGGAAADMSNAVGFFALAPEELRALLRTSKAWEVTLNDVFLALLLQGLARLLPGYRPDPLRPKLAVGCIVNLRQELGLAGRRIFGLFLGSFTVTCEPRTDLPLRELARAVRRQTARIKADRLAVATPLELRFARMLLRCFSLERRRKFYQKNYPLWGGVTNMNLDAIWQPPADGPPVEYLRAVSTGPATPLVLSITTIGGGVTVGLSYRSACYSAAEVEQVKQSFLASVRALAKSA